MSKKSDRREAERTARKLAYQLRQQTPAAAPVAPASAHIETNLLAPAQAFFQQETPATAPEPRISDAQLTANRANAQLSSGPVTIAGKAISSRNNTRHGLATQDPADHFQVLAHENQQLYDRDLADFRHEWKPVTATEHDLVNRLVMHQWLRRRALRLQESVFDSQTGELSDIKKFDLYRRYETQHERSFNKALADLQRLRAFQLRQQNGFESQTRKHQEHEFKMRRLQRAEDQQLQKIAASNCSIERANADTADTSEKKLKAA